MADPYKPPKVPCSSCPYRLDVPSGVWAQEEYVKLPQYDGEIIEQMMKGGTSLFLCHQKDGHLCGGWLKTHGTDNLVALRLHAAHCDDSVWSYDPPTPCFSNGAEACAHGLQDIEHPTQEAERTMDTVSKLHERKRQ